MLINSFHLILTNVIFHSFEDESRSQFFLPFRELQNDPLNQVGVRRKISQHMKDELGLYFPNMVEAVLAHAEWKKLLALGEEISQLLHDILKMSVVPVVVHHALNDPLVEDSRVEETPEDLWIKRRQISEKDQSERVLNVSVHILENYDVIIDELQDLHCAFQIGDEGDRLSLTVNINLSAPVFQNLGVEAPLNEADVLATNFIARCEGVDFETFGSFSLTNKCVLINFAL